LAAQPLLGGLIPWGVDSLSGRCSLRGFITAYFRGRILFPPSIVAGVPRLAKGIPDAGGVKAPPGARLVVLAATRLIAVEALRQLAMEVGGAFVEAARLAGRERPHRGPKDGYRATAFGPRGRQALEELKWRRAGRCCEYGRVPQAYDDAPFEIDHVIAQKHGGPTVPGNRALSGLHDNGHKGPTSPPARRSSTNRRRGPESISSASTGGSSCCAAASAETWRRVP
jgi:hypothetical protein